MTSILNHKPYNIELMNERAVLRYVVLNLGKLQCLCRFEEAATELVLKSLLRHHISQALTET